MESYSCQAMLCISGCVLIGGIIAFIAFSIWKIKSMKDVEARLPRQIERRKNPFGNLIRKLLKIAMKPAMKR